MPAPLREHQHELCDLDGNNGVVFGTEDTGYLTMTRPTITGGEVRTGDVERPGEDGTAMGRDYRGNKTINFELGVLTDRLNGFAGGTVTPLQANLDALNRLEAVWDAEAWRDGPAAYAMLRTCEAGRTSRCYGRPRRWDETVGGMTDEGYTPVLADFALVDSSWYADTEDRAEIRMRPSSLEGGFTAPIVAPLTTIAAQTNDTAITVTGMRATWPVVDFIGPVGDPKVRIGSGASALTIGLRGVLIAAGDRITVDPRPWQRTVLRARDGAGFAGALTYDTPQMKRMRLPIGEHAVTFTGTDDTGRARCAVRWRAARTRP